MSTTPLSMVALGPDNEQERQQWLEALARTVDTTAFCLGAEVTAFETKCREVLEVPHAFGCNSGTDALRLALQAVGVGYGGEGNPAESEVIVPALSFFASASSIAHLGARPVFVDVDPETLTLDIPQTESAFSSNTHAVLPVHLYGQAANMAALLPLCRQHNIAVVEDAAQCFGVRYGAEGSQRTLGSLGDIGTFSFYPTKNLAAPGDAGMMVTRDAKLAAKIQSLRVHGDEGGYQHQSLGWNARMDGFQGAVLAIRLARLPAMQAARERNAMEYLQEIESRSLGDQIRPLGRTALSEHCWHQFIVRVDNRDQVQAALRDSGIASGVYYPSTLPSQPVFSHLGYKTGDFPIAEAATREVLALPVHHRLKEGDPTRVIECIERCLR